jgi:predicted lipoprotein with Yx(FWY)xxD motif
LAYLGGRGRMARNRIWLVAAATFMLVMAACSDDTTTTPVAGDGGETTSTFTSTGVPIGVADVGTGEIEGLGEVLVDGEGYTLYLFLQDEGTTSACTDDCLAAWPPLITEADPQASGGADAALLGTAEQADGSIQVTYADHLLYRYSADTAPGQANGQEVGEVWYAVSPDGQQVEGEVGDDNGGGDGEEGGGPGGDGGGY